MEKRAGETYVLKMNHLILAIILFCLAAEVAIFLLDALMNLAELWYLEKFKKLSNVALEKSFGTWFSVVQNFMVAVTALILSLHYKFVFYRKGRFWGWLLVALFFAYISLDDHLVLHERFSGTLGPIFFNWLFGKDFKVPTYEWLFLLGPLFGVFGVFFLFFLFRQLKDRKNRIILVSGLSLWVVAVILDAWDGTSHAYADLVGVLGFKRIYVRHAFMLFEEMLEMVGSTLFLYLFLSRIRSLYAEPEALVRISK